MQSMATDGRIIASGRKGFPDIETPAQRLRARKVTSPAIDTQEHYTEEVLLKTGRLQHTAAATHLEDGILWRKQQKEAIGHKLS
jgi:hypothetical protein